MIFDEGFDSSKKHLFAEYPHGVYTRFLSLIPQCSDVMCCERLRDAAFQSHTSHVHIP